MSVRHAFVHHHHTGVKPVFEIICECVVAMAYIFFVPVVTLYRAAVWTGKRLFGDRV